MEHLILLLLQFLTVPLEEIFSVTTSGTGAISITSSTFSATNSFTSGGDLTLTNANNFSTVSGSTTFVRNGGANNITWTGGNTFGNVSITNNDDNRIVLANTTGDTFNGTATFSNTNSGGIRISNAGATTFASSLTLNSTGSGGFLIGNGGGTTSLNGALLTSGFTNGALTISNITQNVNVANGSFNPTSFSSTNCNFQGDFSVSITGSGNITITNSTYSSTNTFSGDDFTITNSDFSTTSGSTSFTKVGGGDSDTWSGGNTFGDVIITNNDDNRITLSGGDTFNGTATFICTNAGAIRASYTGTSTFASTITINNSSTGGISFGANGGISNQSSGGMVTTGFTNGALSISNFTQNSTTANGTFNPTSFTVSNSTFGGDFSVTTSSGSISITSSSFTASCTMIAATGLSLTNANNFSTVSGNTILTKNGGAGTNWTGGNTFGNSSGTVTITNNDNDNLNISNSSGDTYNGAVTFNNTGTGGMRISRAGSSTFALGITLNNNNTGGISFGSNGGSSTQTSGGMVTTGFTNGALSISNFTQNNTTANGTFNPTSFTASNSTFGGDFSVTTSSGSISISNCEFTAGNTFESASDIDISNVNSFSTVSGTSTFTKNGGDNDLWDGGNTFGNVVVINNDDSQLRMADNGIGDDFNGSATFIQNSTGLLRVGWDGDNTFSGDISTTGTSSSISFAGGTGTIIIDGNSTQIVSGSTAQPPSIDRLTMLTTGGGNLTLNVPINVNDDLTMTSGIINTDATNILTVGNGASANIGDADSYVNGPFQYILASNSTTRSTLNFPIGKSGDWRPVSLQVAHSQNTSYTYRGEVINSSAHSLGWTLPSSIDTVSHVRYWEVERYLTSSMTSAPSADLRTASGQAPIITLYFDTNDDVRDGANLRIVKNTFASPSEWIDIGGTGAPAYSGGAQLSGSVTSTSSPSSFNSFSTFTLGSGTSGFNPLPVTLVSFSAKIVKDKVQLDWSTSSEYNNDRFEIQFSEDGVVFNNIGQLKGYGTSQVKNDYQFLDSSPIIGLNYYRLKQISTDGSFEYSEVISIYFSEDNLNGVQIITFPNPIVNKEEVNVEIRGMKPEKELQLKWMDMSGKVYLTKTCKTNKSGMLKEKLLFPSQFAKGIYHLVIEDGNKSFTKKILVQ
ncbi:MAG: hypothetical protein OHK0038_20800 [Flammeovirgaceae bacterium]